VDNSALYVARSDRDKGLQKALLLWHLPDERKKVLEALRELGRQDLAEELLPDRGVGTSKQKGQSGTPPPTGNQKSVGIPKRGVKGRKR
jgi:hypothetical protein